MGSGHDDIGGGIRNRRDVSPTAITVPGSSCCFVLVDFRHVSLVATTQPDEQS